MCRTGATAGCAGEIPEGRRWSTRQRVRRWRSCNTVNRRQLQRTNKHRNEQITLLFLPLPCRSSSFSECKSRVFLRSYRSVGVRFRPVRSVISAAASWPLIKCGTLPADNNYRRPDEMLCAGKRCRVMPLLCVRKCVYQLIATLPFCGR